jgi:hypothetical protein
MKNFLIFIFLFFYSTFVLADANLDQWQDSEKTYKDLINEGFEVKAFNTNNIEIRKDLIMIMFVTVLQKDKDVYECQEYQTISLRESMETLDISFICRSITQPYKIGLGT